ncbi:SBBP repeat-containing protein [Pyxidicoccus sp. 3LG]
MDSLKSIRSTILASALVLLAAPGCQGEELPASSALFPEESATRPQALGCEVNQVPVMTSNTAPGGVVTRSGVINSSYEAWQAFDGTNSMWISAEKQTPAWLAYEWADGPRTITRYALTYTNGSITTRAPKNFTFEGWDGSAWVVLDTRTNEVGWPGYERREYAVTSPGAYRKYRLSVTDDNDSRTGVEVISLGQLELLGCEPLRWTRALGVSGALSLNSDVAVHSLGYSFAAGMTNGAVAGTKNGNMDVLLAGYDTNGALLWSQQFGVAGQVAAAFSITKSPSELDLYVTGLTGGGLHGNTQAGSQDVFLAKYSVGGTRQWTRQLGVAGKTTRGYGVAVDASNNVHVSGDTNGALDGVPLLGFNSAFLVRYGASGSRQWTRLVGVANKHTYGARTAVDGSGNVYITGYTNGGLDGNVLTGTDDAFLTKFSPAGVKQWTRQFGVAGGRTSGSAVGVDAAGNVYLTGGSACTIDGVSTDTGLCAILVKYDASGVRQWLRAFGAGHSLVGTALAINSQGIHLTGSAYADMTLPPPQPITPAPRPFVARYDTAGTRLALQQLPQGQSAGVGSQTEGAGIGVDSAGMLYVAGRVRGAFDGHPQLGTDDAFVKKLAQP